MLAASLVGAVAVLVALAGAPAHAILGGRAESHQMHMYMAGLVDLSSKTVFCGAALYTSKYVITSAQCDIEIAQGDMPLAADALLLHRQRHIAVAWLVGLRRKRP